MPAYLPIPEGLELPSDSETFDLVTTYRVDGDQLYPVAVDGIPFPEAAEAPEGEGEGEMEVEMSMPSQGQVGPQDFMSAVEQALAKPKR